MKPPLPMSEREQCVWGVLVERYGASEVTDRVTRDVISALYNAGHLAGTEDRYREVHAGRETDAREQLTNGPFVNASSVIDGYLFGVLSMSHEDAVIHTNHILGRLDAAGYSIPDSVAEAPRSDDGPDPDLSYGAMTR